MRKYNSDSPIISSDDNKFVGRAEYAEKIAQAVLSLDEDSSYVVALYSKWGYGKTSVMNMTKTALSDKAIIIDIKPWNYLSDKELAANLLIELDERFAISFIDRAKIWVKKRSKNILKTVSDASEVTSDVIGEINKPAGLSVKAVAKTTDKLTSLGSYKKFRARIEKSIKDSGKKAVVFIDDIDRLDAQEILNTFKLIRSVADIKGVIYFLAFDEKLVCEAIDENLPKKTGGKEYVDKIVQIPLELPRIDRDELDEYMLDELNQILEDTKIVISDSEVRDVMSFYRKIRNNLDTPRAVVRCSNALRFAIPLTKDEANIADVVCIELLRVLRPDLYKIVRNNRALLTEDPNDVNYYISSYSDNRHEKTKQTLNELFENEDDLRLLDDIFPVIGKYCFNHSSWEDAKQNRKNKRIKSPAYFNRYFSYSIGKNDVADNEVIDVLQKEKIAKADTDKLFNNYLSDKITEKIQDNADLVKDMNGLCVNLVLSVEKLPTANKKHNLFFTTIDRAIYTVDELLLNSKGNSNLEIYKEIIAKCQSLETLAYAIRSAHIRFSGDKEEKKTLTEEEYNDYKQFAVKIIKDKMKKKLLPVAQYGTVSKELYEYERKFTDSANDINNYMKKMIRTGIQAVDFISQFLGEWTNMETGQASRSDLFDQNYATYKFWFLDKFDANYLYDLISKSEEYKGYKDITQDKIMHFDRHDIDLKEINHSGKEQTAQFRNVIAQQFVYIFESGVAEKTEDSTA